MNLLGGQLIKVARLRAGFTQRELGERLRHPQSSIARWESGARQPTIDTLVKTVRACGLDPVVSLFAMDRSNDGFIWQLLDETPAQRLRFQVAAANGMRPMLAAAAAQRAGEQYTEPADFEPIAVLRALASRGVRHVLVGRLAESVRGSPILPTGAEVAVCLEGSVRNRASLDQALRDLGAMRWRDPAERPLEIPFELRELATAERWWVEAAGSALAIVQAPHGATGFGDLLRHASTEELDSGVTADVASLLDLIRIADAAIDPGDRAGLPTLRRALELSTDYRPPEEREAIVPEGLEEIFAEQGIAHG